MNVKEALPGLSQIVLTIPRGGFESFITGWLIRDGRRGRTILMETGPAISIEPLVRDLSALGVDRIDYLLYTHVHLDHSGGAGQFHKYHPETKIIAPTRGRPHLVNPEKLVAGSRTNLGDLCDVYGEPLPLPEEALAPVDFALEGLEIIDTPGHAPHHSSYVYELDGTRVLFAGEAGGCCFELEDGSVFMRPATPHKFFYDAAIASLDRLIALEDIDLVCYPHSGCSRECKKLLAMSRAQMELWREIISKLPEDAKTEDAAAAVKERDPVMKLLAKLPDGEREREEFFIRQSVDGYLGYIRRG